MLESQLFKHKITGKIVSQISIMELNQYEKLICDTCKKPILSNQGCVDDGIKENVHHHMSCY